MITIGMTTTTIANEETNVDIEIDDAVQLDVKPDQLDYTSGGDFETSALEPGEQRELSDRGFEHIDIQNIGSQRLENIYAEASLHDNNPFGSADDDNHNTGNLVLMSTETAFEDGYDIATGTNRGALADIEDPHYVNRIEFFEEQPPEYILTEDEDSPTDNLDFEVDVGEESGTTVSGNSDAVEVGRFRVGELNYYFTYYHDDTDGSSYLLVGNSPETPTDLGTFDFTSENEEDYTVIGLADSDVLDYTDGFALASFDPEDYDSEEAVLDGESGIDIGASSLETGDIEEREYNLYVDNSDGDLDPESVVRASFNVGFEFPDETTTGIEDTSGQQYILEDSSEEEALQPGENFPVDFGIQLPNGIDHDSIQEGTVTFQAEGWN